jgi:hypothetical protein
LTAAHPAQLDGTSRKVDPLGGPAGVAAALEEARFAAERQPLFARRLHEAGLRVDDLDGEVAFLPQGVPCRGDHDAVAPR